MEPCPRCDPDIFEERMTDSGKKVEVRYGPFACSVEGYEDPVQQLRVILSMMQAMLAETPALAGAEQNLLDDGRIEQALGAEASLAVERPGPGAMVIRKDGGDAVIRLSDARRAAPAETTDAEVVDTEDPAPATEPEAAPDGAAADVPSPAFPQSPGAGADDAAPPSARPEEVARYEGGAVPSEAFPHPATGTGGSWAETSLGAAEPSAPVERDPALNEDEPLGASNGSAPAATRRIVNIFAPPPRNGSEARTAPAAEMSLPPGRTAATGATPAAGVDPDRAASSDADAGHGHSLATLDPATGASAEPPPSRDAPSSAASIFAPPDAEILKPGDTSARTTRLAGDVSVQTPADLASLVGASEVEDLLVVSAAWMTLFEDKPGFARADTMRVFENLPGDHPRTLETRIKGFGNLVRQGTFAAGDDGTFTLCPSERHRFEALLAQP